FMLKEIHEQPAVVKKTLDAMIKNGVPEFSEVGLTDDFIRGINRIYVVACGTAMHAGIVARYAIERLARIPVAVETASEFRYMNPIVGKNDLVILVSQSGETADTKAALELAKEKGAKTLAVVNVKYSAIARAADMCINTLAGPEIAVASTKAYTVQIAVLYLIAFRMAFAVGEIDEEKLRELTREIQKAPAAI
ncbi:MAG TPA: glutamine--fructose-6-phosphate aminotransferase, partial [Ruminococcaceae bacterium]|nr:glutamine--fructose-6-phosphate aminotransferase [Oscillospiraceae bacterium]